MKTLADYIQFPSREEKGKLAAIEDILNMKKTKIIEHNNPEVQKIAESYAGSQAGREVPISPLERLSKVKDALYKRGAVNSALAMDVSVAKMQQQAAQNQTDVQTQTFDKMNKVFDMANKVATLYGDKAKGVELANSLMPELNMKYEKSKALKEGDFIKFTNPLNGKEYKMYAKDTENGVKASFILPADDPLFKSIDNDPYTISKITEYVDKVGMFPPQPTIRRFLKESKEFNAKYKGTGKGNKQLNTNKLVKRISDIEKAKATISATRGIDPFTLAMLPPEKRANIKTPEEALKAFDTEKEILISQLPPELQDKYKEDKNSGGDWLDQQPEIQGLGAGNAELE